MLTGMSQPTCVPCAGNPQMQLTKHGMTYVQCLVPYLHQIIAFFRQVWHVRVDVHVLDHCGNLADAAALAALAALLAFRRPEASVAPGGDGGRAAVTLHAPDAREPLPLSLHHLPLAVSFALFEVRRVAKPGEGSGACCPRAVWAARLLLTRSACTSRRRASRLSRLPPPGVA